MGTGEAIVSSGGVNGVGDKGAEKVEEKKEARRGWFGFGR